MPETVNPPRSAGIAGKNIISLSVKREGATPSNSSDQQNDLPEPVETTANTFNTAKGSKLVLLQTARAVASDDTSGRSVNVRILFDTGSQRSYVTDLDLRERTVTWFRFACRK